jgi:putative IMPACT (imprinted ancient) family translation regulator
MTTLNFTLDYEQFQLFEYALKKADGKIVEQNFAGQIQLTVKLPTKDVIALSSFL